MDYNSISDYLITLFQDVSLNGVNDSNLQNIESGLTMVLDSDDIKLFNHIALVNLIYLLDSSNTSTILIHRLVAELKLKSLRLIYTGRINLAITEDAKCCTGHPSEKKTTKEELPLLKNLPSLPPYGEIGIGRTKTLVGSGEELITEYEIDHTGQALRVLSSYRQKINELVELNDNVFDRVLNDINEKESQQNTAIALTEADL